MKSIKLNIALSFFLVSFSFGCSTSTEEVAPNNPNPTNPSTGTGTGVVNTSPRTVINNLSVPWEIIWGPDNFIWTTERNGRISRINPESGQQTVIHTVSGVVQTAGAGLLGMVLHPNFPTLPYVYVVYVHSGNGTRTRVSRFTYANNSLSDENILLGTIPAGSTHNGAKLLINNNLLYVTTGDTDEGSLSQNLNSLVGKTLRMTLTGGIPSDNPFPNSYVWSYGHRNAQGLLLHPNGNLYNSEHGPTGDDEFNLITKGGNYGWPNIAGVTDNANERTFANLNPVVDAMSVWSPAIAPADMVFYSNARIPQFQNKVLMAALRGQTLIALTLSSDGRTVTRREEFLSNQFGRIRDICVSPNGRVFIATGGSSYSSDSGHSIVEISGL